MLSLVYTLSYYCVQLTFVLILFLFSLAILHRWFHVIELCVVLFRCSNENLTKTDVIQLIVRKIKHFSELMRKS